MPSTAAKAKLYPFRPRSRVLASLLRSCAVVLAINWLAQGMRGMDRKELSFRLLLEAAMGLGSAAVLVGLGQAPVPALLAGLFLAHGFGFTLNGQFWVCARYCPSYRGDAARLGAFLARSAVLLRACRWLDEAVIIGSLGERVLGPRSDIDLRLIFPPGIVAWVRVNLLLLRLRALAFLGGVPLDAYAYDDLASLRRFDPSEPLVVVLDRRGALAQGFAERRLMPLP
jgi:hypothetical protein